MDDNAALEQDLEGGDGGLEQGVEIGNVVVGQFMPNGDIGAGHGVENGDADVVHAAENGDIAAGHVMMNGVANGEVGIEHAVENGEAGVGQGMPNGYIGGGHVMLNGDAIFVHGAENGDIAAGHVMMNGVANGEVGIEHAVENGEAGVGQGMPNGYIGGGHVMLNGDAIFVHAVENGDEVGHGMPNGEIGGGNFMLNGHAIVVHALENGVDEGAEDGELSVDEDEAGLDQGVDDDEATLDQGEEDGEVGLNQEDDDPGLHQAIAAAAAALPPQYEVLPPSVPEYEAFPAFLPLQWGEFQRSGPPQTIVLLGDRDEEDGDGDGDAPQTMGFLFRHGDDRRLDTIVPEETVEVIREAFITGNVVADAVLPGGRRIVFNFLRKVCVEVDAQGTPLKAVAVYWADPQLCIFVSARILGMDEDRVRQLFDAYSRGRLAITAVRRCHHHAHAMEAFCEKMKVQNPVFGWYGSVEDDVLHGANMGESLRPNWERVDLVADANAGERACGRGIHVAPLSRILRSAMLCLLGAIREPGHMLLCALAPGFQEVVQAGSPQQQPSNPMYHSGVGNPSPRGDPAWYVFWEMNQTVDILPLYMVTFTL